MRYKRYPTNASEHFYKRYRNDLHTAMLKAEREHYDNLFMSYKSNMKKSWELITEIINKKSTHRKTKFYSDNGSIIESKDVANNFNNFFCKCRSLTCKQNPGYRH